MAERSSVFEMLADSFISKPVFPSSMLGKVRGVHRGRPKGSRRERKGVTVEEEKLSEEYTKLDDQDYLGG